MKRIPPHNLEPGAEGQALQTISGKASWAGTGYREVLMADGTTAPPEPLYSEDGTDWLYSEVTR